MPNIRIEALATADIAPLRELACLIWHRDFRDMISTAQMDYMLAQRYAPEVIAAELERNDIWWHKLSDGECMLGFSACLLTENPEELKLDKIYVHSDFQRLGLGAKLMDNAVQLAARLSKRFLILAVNRGNAQAINAYKKYGFTIREAAVKDIGGGFVMDDFIMLRSVKG